MHLPKSIFKISPRIFSTYSNINEQRELNLFGLKYVFEQGIYILTKTNYTHTELIEIGSSIIKSFKGVNKKGYITRKNSINPSFALIKKHLKSLGIKTPVEDFGISINTFSLWYNFIVLGLLILIEKELRLARTDQLDDKGLDLLADLECLNYSLSETLDPFLKVQIRKRGVSIIQNIYTGFDTEYEIIDEGKNLNKLISIQIALQTRTLVKVPLNSIQDISYVHPLTSEITNFYKPKTFNWKASDDCSEKTINEMSLINDNLKYYMKIYRDLKYTSRDLITASIIEEFHKLEKVTFFEDVKNDQIIFALPLSETKTKLIYPEKDYSMRELVELSGSLASEALANSYNDLISQLAQNVISFDHERLLKWMDNRNMKPLPRSRTSVSFRSGDKISINLIKNIYVCSHYNPADLSLLKDFTILKTDLNILNKSFITLGKPLTYGGFNLFIRDTMLLAPANSRSLDAIGKLYDSESGGVYSKKEIPFEYLTQMSRYVKEDKDAFEQYAMRDALIVLKHATEMETFNFTLNKTGVPVTLSSMGKNFVFEKWKENFGMFFPYQLSGDCLMGNSNEVQTPKGLFATGNVGLHMSYYIGNYKGGRNESFMYGSENETLWFDYDLVSAYTTALADLSLPDYNQGKMITAQQVFDMSDENLLNGYLIFNAIFKFPENTKYPSIPCYIDNATTVYPLSGEALISGPEFLLARNQKCVFDIKSAFYIPPTVKTVERRGMKLTINTQPFYTLIKELQSKRREYPKGHIMNSLYKDLSNSIYGNVVRGMSNKLSFDTKTGQMFRMTGTQLSNPILASRTTALIRSVIGECLHNISKLGGVVVSVTTDGFLTNIADLENRLLSLPQKEAPLFNKYKLLIENLTNDDNSKALEIKNEGKGIVSWATRGQLGIESKIKATAGFQGKGYTHAEIVSFYKKALSSEDKEFEYTQSSLRSAKDVFKQGGHVTEKLRDQIVRVLYDNRREIIEPENFEGFDLSKVLLDSKPFKNKEDSLQFRFLSKFAHKKSYLKSVTPSKTKNKYKSYIEVGIRNFIKGYLSKEPCFGLNGTEFLSYGEIMHFIFGFDHAKCVKLTRHSISHLKQRKIIIRPVPNTPENRRFADYIQSKLPYFDRESFLKL